MIIQFDTFTFGTYAYIPIIIKNNPIFYVLIVAVELPSNFYRGIAVIFRAV